MPNDSSYQIIGKKIFFLSLFFNVLTIEQCKSCHRAETYSIGALLCIAGVCSENVQQHKVCV